MYTFFSEAAKLQRDHRVSFGSHKCRESRMMGTVSASDPVIGCFVLAAYWNFQFIIFYFRHPGTSYVHSVLCNTNASRLIYHCSIPCEILPKCVGFTLHSPLRESFCWF
ncbi:hypothetical protein CPC08DRAFT_58224 [Agrocybe pediades]|nr:hypothetical protein CPC08DRAFT_58224 [Agrocybe pediades]